MKTFPTIDEANEHYFPESTERSKYSSDAEYEFHKLMEQLMKDFKKGIKI